MLRELLILARAEARALLRMRSTLTVLGLAWGAMMMAFSLSGERLDWGSAGGEWTPWMVWLNPFDLTLPANALVWLAIGGLAVFGGSVRITAMRRDGRWHSLAGLPTGTTRTLIGIALGRFIVLAIALAVVIVPIGLTCCATPVGEPVWRMLTMLLVSWVVLAHFLTGTIALACWLPRAWMAGALAGIFTVGWAALSMWYPLTIWPDVDRLLASVGTTASPFWLLRSTSVGVLPVTLVIVEIATVGLHIVLARVGFSVTRFMPREAKSQWQLDARNAIIRGLPVLGGFVALSLTAMLWPTDLDLTHARMSEPGAPLVRAIDDREVAGELRIPLDRGDTPVWLAYARRLEARTGGRVTWSGGYRINEWFGLILRAGDTGEPLLIELGDWPADFTRIRFNDVDAMLRAAADRDVIDSTDQVIDTTTYESWLDRAHVSLSVAPASEIAHLEALAHARLTLEAAINARVGTDGAPIAADPSAPQTRPATRDLGPRQRVYLLGVDESREREAWRRFLFIEGFDVDALRYGLPREGGIAPARDLLILAPSHALSITRSDLGDIAAHIAAGCSAVIVLPNPAAIEADQWLPGGGYPAPFSTLLGNLKLTVNKATISPTTARAERRDRWGRVEVQATAFDFTARAVAESTDVLWVHPRAYGIEIAPSALAPEGPLERTPLWRVAVGLPPTLSVQPPPRSTPDIAPLIAWRPVPSQSGYDPGIVAVIALDAFDLASNEPIGETERNLIANVIQRAAGRDSWAQVTSTLNARAGSVAALRSLTTRKPLQPRTPPPIGQRSAGSPTSTLLALRLRDDPTFNEINSAAASDPFPPGPFVYMLDAMFVAAYAVPSMLFALSLWRVIGRRRRRRAIT